MNTDNLSQDERLKISQAYEKIYEDDVVNFVPGEVCIVASVPSGDGTKNLYDAVRVLLNRRLADVLRQQHRNPDAKGGPPGTGGHWASAEDRRAPLLVGQFQGSSRAQNGETLLPLRRVDNGMNPSITLARPNGTTTFLGFYQLDADVSVHRNPKDNDNRWRIRRQRLVDLVRELVILVNLTPRLRGGDSGSSLEILAATPNWLTAASHSGSGNGCGSPGGLPRAIPVGDAPKPLSRLFRFSNDTLRAYDEKAEAVARQHADGVTTAPSGVVVAVLDSSPTSDDLKRALDAAPGADAAWLMRLVEQHVQLDGPLSANPAAFDHLPYVPNWNGPERNDQAYPDREHFRMADHGLFVSGLIYHLAPAAEIHLIRVLGDTGIGDMSTIIGALVQLPSHLLKAGANQRLIVNLSLGCELPLDERFAPRWFPATVHGQRVVSGSATAVALDDFRDLIHLNLREAVGWLIEQGALVVAAVGNDYYISPIGPKEPRYPAAYDSVLGVASVKANDTAADYTNLGDERVPLVLNGVATFGGNATLPGGLPGNGPAVTDNPPDAVKGIFSAKNLPLNAGPNLSGWVDWAGTSFATPIISGIAANLWADHRSGVGKLDPNGVASAIRAMGGAGGPGSAPMIEAKVP